MAKQCEDLFREGYAPGMTDDAIHVVVEDVFRLEKRGIVVSPQFDPDRLPWNSELTIDVVHPDGQSGEVRGHFVVEHSRLLDGGSRWQGAIVIELEYVGVVRPGDSITARVVK